ncbi:hypothetical protein [Streptomyces bohaiensis]|uniref:hypothetical protein n=1 Tax=Streptomyces bohaiensis TaxID=1431344 RepID=UPI003B813064
MTGSDTHHELRVLQEPALGPGLSGGPCLLPQIAQEIRDGIAGQALITTAP